MPELNCTKVVFEPPDLDAPAVLDELVRALAGISLKEFLRNERAGMYDIYEEDKQCCKVNLKP